MDKSFIPAAKYHILTPLFDLGCTIAGLGKDYRRKLLNSMNIQDAPLVVLDAGCGTGSLAVMLKKENPSIKLHCVDADKNILGIALKKSLNAGADLELQESLLQRLPFSDEHFDVIYSSLVIHHLPTAAKQRAFSEIHRVLKKDGTFFLADFGKPRSKFFALYSWFAATFEEGLDNYRGLIPGMMYHEGFKEIQRVGEHRNIHFLKAKK